MAIRDLVPWRAEREVPVRRAEEALPAFHRAFDDFFDQFFRGFDLTPFQAFGDGWATAAPALDMEETDKEYKVSAELPGWDEKDIDVTLSGDTLTIKGEKKEESEEGKEGSEGYRYQSRYGSFHRSVRLPAEVDRDKVEAACERGVLTVTLPKTEEAQKQTRKIEVKSA